MPMGLSLPQNSTQIQELAVGADELGDDRRKMRQIFGGDHFGARANDQIAEAAAK